VGSLNTRQVLSDHAKSGDDRDRRKRKKAFAWPGNVGAREACSFKHSSLDRQNPRYLSTIEGDLQKVPSLWVGPSHQSAVQVMKRLPTRFLMSE